MKIEHNTNYRLSTSAEISQHKFMQKICLQRNQQPSHWTTDGMKPYMKYSEYNGTGYVEQNVAVIGYGNNAVQKCEDGAAICKKIEPYFQIDRLQWNMVDNDTLCCENKHKANILDKVHNSVSIGIAYDDYYFALVPEF